MRNYLSAIMIAMEVDSEIASAEAICRDAGERTLEYSIASEEVDRGAIHIFLIIKSLGQRLDEKLYLAFQILDYALLSAPGAPLKKALAGCRNRKRHYGFL